MDGIDAHNYVHRLGHQMHAKKHAHIPSSIRSPMVKAEKVEAPYLLLGGGIDVDIGRPGWMLTSITSLQILVMVVFFFCACNGVISVNSMK